MAFPIDPTNGQEYSDPSNITWRYLGDYSFWTQIHGSQTGSSSYKLDNIRQNSNILNTISESREYSNSMNVIFEDSDYISSGDGVIDTVAGTYTLATGESVTLSTIDFGWVGELEIIIHSTVNPIIFTNTDNNGLTLGTPQEYGPLNETYNVYSFIASECGQSLIVKIDGPSSGSNIIKGIQVLIRKSSLSDTLPSGEEDPPIQEGNPVTSGLIADWEASKNWDGTNWTDTINDIVLTSNWGTAPTYNETALNDNGGLSFSSCDLINSTTLGDMLGSLPNGLTMAFIAQCTDVNTTRQQLIEIDNTIAVSYDLDSGNVIAATGSDNGNYVCQEDLYELPHIEIVRITSTRMDVITNGNISGAATISSSLPDVTSGLLVVGSNGNYANPFIGDYGGLMIYDRALTNTEISNLNSYLCTKWGITNLEATVDGYGTNFYYSDTSYPSNLADSAIFTASGSNGSAVPAKLNDLTASTYWEQLYNTNPWIQAEWSSAQTISSICFIPYVRTTIPSTKPNYTDPVEVLYWGGSDWISTGTFDWYGQLMVEFRTPISTTKLKFSIGADTATNGYTIREIIIN